MWKSVFSWATHDDNRKSTTSNILLDVSGVLPGSHGRPTIGYLPSDHTIDRNAII